MQPIRDNARVLTASLVGTAVEYYDFLIYATAAALFFGDLFFPTWSAASRPLLSFATFGVAFLARPLGGMFFGHFGDRVGRKSTLVASLLLMGGSTLGIAFLPSYAQAEAWGIGWIAPVLLCLLRFGQGLGLGGEWTGAALLAVENAPKGWEVRFGAAPQVGVPIGVIAANGMFLLLGMFLSPAQMADWGWRVPFLASAVLVGIGLWVRLRIGETPEFQQALDREAPVAVPVSALARRHLGAMVAGSAVVVTCFAIFYLATAYALAQGTGPLHFARQSFLGLQMLANAFLGLGVVTAATLADRYSARRVLAAGMAVAVPMGMMFGPGLGSGSLALAGLTLCAMMFFMGFTNAPLGSWLARLFPVHLRYTGVAFAFNVGGVIGGALTPFAAQAMSGAGLASYAGWLASLAGVVSLLGIRWARAEQQVYSPIRSR
ncbi:MAG: MFS transporter [Sphingomonadales bacterium]|nr:MFS transporter [Sphingomonadales bacterium]